MTRILHFLTDRRYRCIALFIFLAAGFASMLGIVEYKTRDHLYPVKFAKSTWPSWDLFEVGVASFRSTSDPFHTEFIHFESYQDVLSGFINGEIDAACMTLFEALLAAQQGKDFKIVLLLDYSTGGDGILAQSSIRSLLDLKGKTIGMVPNSVAHFTTLKALQKSGLTPNEVRFEFYEIDTLISKFRNQELDAISFFDPYLTRVSRSSSSNIIFTSREIPRSICDVVVVDSKVIESRPDIVRSWVRSWHYILSKNNYNPDTIQTALEQYNPIYESMVPFNNIALTSLWENFAALAGFQFEGYLLKSLTDMYEVMKSHELLDTDIDLRGLVDPSFVEAYSYGKLSTQ